MCLGIPGQIVEMPDEHSLANVDFNGVRRKVNLGLVKDEGIQIGDWVLIHVGFALSKIDEEEANATLAMLNGMGEAYEDELEALRESRLDDLVTTDKEGA